MVKYPKLTLLIGTFIAAYLLHNMGAFDRLTHFLNGGGYWSALLAGILFSFGFTAAFGVAIFVDLAVHVNPFIAAIVGGIGAMLSDVCIFSLVRFAIFHDEVHQLRETRLIRFIREKFNHPSVSNNFRKILLWSFAGIIIASPLPDEFGAALVGSATSVRSREFALLCLALNTLGILVILLGVNRLQL